MVTSSCESLLALGSLARRRLWTDCDTFQSDRGGSHPVVGASLDALGHGAERVGVTLPIVTLRRCIYPTRTVSLGANSSACSWTRTPEQ
jgi:hypothetical protein